MEEVTAKDVRVVGGFWGQRLETNARRAIFHQWEQLEASGCIANFRIAAGEAEGFREGWFFADSDAYKWLDAASGILGIHPDPKLTALVDDFIALLSRAQEPDGYLFTYNQVHFPGVRWENLQIEHELYCHGHLIEAGVSHHEATGERAMLDVARRAADLLLRDFLGAGPQRTPGHEEIEIALLRLFRATSHAPYIHLAQRFIERRGRARGFAASILRQNSSVAARKQAVEQQRQQYLATHRGYTPSKLPPGNFAKKPRNSQLRWYASALTGKYFQQHAPVRRQTVPVGHAVRFGYLQTAVAMLHRLCSDASLIPALQTAWERMATRRMYVTGGLGSLPGLEGFGRDYELHPEYAYAETCAALASLFWNWEMTLISGEARYSDLFEWQLYNAAAVGMGLNGESYLYNNPLLCRGGVARRPWFSVPCCPSNLSRTWAALGKYIYSRDGHSLWIHQYVSSSADLRDGLRIEMESGLPWEGRVRVRFGGNAPTRRVLHLRVPSWVDSFRVLLNDQPLDAVVPATTAALPATACGYAPHKACYIQVDRMWNPGDELTLRFATPIRLLRQDSRLQVCGGMAAVARGPLVYCLESVDNPEVDIFSAEIASHSLHAAYEPDLLGGTTVIMGETRQGQPLTFIPYMLWANRGESQMTVFVRSDG
jgi:hypothetical protein